MVVKSTSKATKHKAASHTHHHKESVSHEAEQEKLHALERELQGKYKRKRTLTNAQHAQQAHYHAALHNTHAAKAHAAMRTTQRACANEHE